MIYRGMSILDCILGQLHLFPGTLYIFVLVNSTTYVFNLIIFLVPDSVGYAEVVGPGSYFHCHVKRVISIVKERLYLFMKCWGSSNWVVVVVVVGAS